MGENSKIEWTDHTFNPWWGCTHVHEGCRHCYAETWANRFGVKWAPSGVRRLCSEDVWRQPLKWNRKAEQLQQRARVFCASMADVFEDWSGPILDKSGEVWTKPYSRSEWDRNNWQTCEIETMKSDPQGWQYVTMDDVRRELFRLIDATPWLDWLLLTKRPENIERMWVSRVELQTDLDEINYRQNVWLGTSVSDQASADKQIPELLKCRALSPVLFLSIEPLLGPVDLRKWLCPDVANWQCQKCGGFQNDFGNCLHCGEHKNYLTGSHAANHRKPGTFTGWENRQPLDWVIVGGESGQNARPMHPDWARSLRDQCQAANVPLFFKQWGEFSTEQTTPVLHTSVHSGVAMDEPTSMFRVGKQAAGRLLDGRKWNEFPRIEVTL